MYLLGGKKSVGRVVTPSVQKKKLSKERDLIEYYNRNPTYLESNIYHEEHIS